MRVLVTGGAGFIGSHLCERWLAEGAAVAALDDLSTGSEANLAAIGRHPRFTLVIADACSADLSRYGRFDIVYHLASPACTPDFLAEPLKTLAAGSRATENMLRSSATWGARFVLASTSEVYGDPLVVPQTEEYRGNVNPVGPRSAYDEAKRFAEALTTAYRLHLGADTAIVRIFNTYGPRQRPLDVVGAFVTAALTGQPLAVHGDGSQSRTFCYVTDTVRALCSIGLQGGPGPINVGSPLPITIHALARKVADLTGGTARVEYGPPRGEDPSRREPDIGKALSLLGWEPGVCIEEGLSHTIAYWRERLAQQGAKKPCAC